MKLRSLKDNLYGVVDLGLVLMIGIAFVGLVVVAYIIYTIYDQLISHTPTGADSHGYMMIYNTSKNITAGFSDAINLILIAITIFILAIAISALLMLRSR